MDETTRTHRRRALQGDAEAAARALQDRVRAGTLTQEALLIAAVCGDEGAVLALDRPASETLGRLMADIPEGELGTQALTRGVLAAWQWAFGNEPPAVIGTYELVRQERIGRFVTAGLEWEKDGNMRRWADQTPAGNGMRLPRPERSFLDGKVYLSRDRMVRSISACVDRHYNNTVGGPVDGPHQRFRKDVDVRAGIAEKFRVIVAKRIIRYVLEGT